MVALLVSLRWRQLRHQLSRNPWMIVTLIITGMIALGLLAVLTAGLVALRFATPEGAVTALVLTGAAIVIGWWIGSILVSADDGAVKAVEALPLLAQHPAIRDHHVYAVGLDTFRLDYYSATNMVNRLVEQFS